MVIDAACTTPAASLVITGRAQTVHMIRGALKEASITRTVRVKAYWDTNRAGLDETDGGRGATISTYG